MAKRRAGKDKNPFEAMLETLRSQIPPEMLAALIGQADMESIHPVTPKVKKNSPRGKAISLVQKSYSTENVEEARELLLKAIAVDPNYGTSYAELAEMAESEAEMLRYREQAVEAWKRSLPADFEKHNDGRLYDEEEGQEFFMAQLALARGYVDAQRYADGVAAYEYMLQLDHLTPDVFKAELMALHLDMDQDKEAAQLITRFPHGDGISWLYGHALLMFRLNGASATANETLDEAVDACTWVAELILSSHADNTIDAQYYTETQEDEIRDIATRWRRPWLQTPGAKAWLRAHLAKYQQEAAPRSYTWPQLKSQVKRLAQSDECWRLDVVRIVPENKQDQDRWKVVIATDDAHDMLACEDSPTKPTAPSLMEVLGEAILDNDANEPMRPAKIYVRNKTLVTQLQKSLKPVGIACEVDNDWDLFDTFVRFFLNNLGIQERSQTLHPLADTELMDLPREEDEVWQVDSRPIDRFVFEKGRFQRWWITLVIAIADPDQPLVVYQQMTPTKPDVNGLWAILTYAMARNGGGGGRRPGTIEVVNDALQNELTDLLASVEVDCVVPTELEDLTTVFESFQESMQERDMKLPAVTEAPGITTAQLSAFYTAAAAFFRARPWRHVQGDRRINIACSELSVGSVDGMVMGQAGEVLGLALHEDRENLAEMLSESGERDFEEPQTSEEGVAVFRSLYRDQTGMSLLFNEEQEIAFRDLDAIAEHGFAIAAPEAYPFVIHFERGAMRSPLAWEIDLLTGTLHAVLTFIGTKPTATQTAHTPEGKKLTLTWVNGNP